MKILSILAISAIMLGTGLRAGAAETVYKLYCAAAKVQVDQRSFAEMKKAYGPDVCNFGDFTTREQAIQHSSVFGGEGARCSCR